MPARLPAALLAALAVAGCATRRAPDLADAIAVLRSHRVVDLTHAFAPGIPHWPGFPDERVQVAYWYDPRPGTLGSGFFAEVFTHVGQWGTHVDPPAHFHPGLATVDRIDPREMLAPMVVLDVHEAVSRDADYTLRMDDVLGWEARHGRIPAGAFVAMRTDWSARWPDAAAMRNADAQGVAHYPGWSRETLRFLFEERGVAAIGHETTDTDPGVSTSRDDYALETDVLGRGRWQIELLAGLDQVPEAGALAIVTFPKPENGSGFPARVLAVLP